MQIGGAVALITRFQIQLYLFLHPWPEVPIKSKISLPFNFLLQFVTNKWLYIIVINFLPTSETILEKLNMGRKIINTMFEDEKKK